MHFQSNETAASADEPSIEIKRVTLHDDDRPYRCVMARVDYPPAGTGHRQLASSLTTGERRYLDRARSPERRQDFVMSRFAAKLATRAAVARPVPFTAIDIQRGVFNQPVLTVPDDPGLDVSLTHSGGTAVALIHPRACPMGIDLEGIDTGTVAAARGHLSAYEAALDTRPEHGIVLWTAKEALSKALKTGLTVPFDVLRADEVRPVAGGWSVIFKSFPHFRVRAQRLGDRVLAVAHPARATLTALPFAGAAVPASRLVPTGG